MRPEHGSSVLADQEGDEARGGRRIRGPVQHGRGVVRRQRDLGRKGDGRDPEICGLGRIEEACIELARLQPSDEGFLGFDLGRIFGHAEHGAREAGSMVHLLRLIEQLDRKRALGIKLRIGPPDPYAGLLEHFVPRARAELRGEAAVRIVADHQRRLREADRPGDEAAVRRTPQQVVHGGTRADEHVGAAEMGADLHRERVRAAGIALEPVSRRVREGGRDPALHRRDQGAGVEDVHCRTVRGARVPRDRADQRGGRSKQDRAEAHRSQVPRWRSRRFSCADHSVRDTAAGNDRSPGRAQQFCRIARTRRRC